MSEIFHDAKITPSSMHNFCIMQWGFRENRFPEFSISMPQDAAEFILAARDLRTQLAAALEREEGLYKENRWLRGVDIAPLREHDGKRILCVDPDKFNQLIEKQLLGESTIADLRANLVAARDCFAQAYASGYQGGHNDTVEGQYGDPCELGIEYVDENLGEYDWLSATPKPLAVVEGYVYLRGEFGAAPWCRVDIEGHEKTVMLDFHKDESEAWPGTFAKAIILPAAQGEAGEGGGS